MHMLSLFPQILFLAPFSAFLIRIALAALLAFAAWQHITRTDTTSRTLAVLELLAGAALLVGAWTQAVSIAGFFGILAGYVFPRMRVYPKSTMLLGLVLCLSLLVTGAGVFAFDLPL